MVHGGGDYLLMAQEVEGYFQFWRKTHIFKATGGAIKGGHMGGRTKGEANGGAMFVIHGGRSTWTPSSSTRGRSTWSRAFSTNVNSTQQFTMAGLTWQQNDVGNTATEASQHNLWR